MEKDRDIFKLEDYQAAWDKKRAAECKHWGPLLTEELLKEVMSQPVQQGKETADARPTCAETHARQMPLSSDAISNDTVPAKRRQAIAAAAVLAASTIALALWQHSNSAIVPANEETSVLIADASDIKYSATQSTIPISTMSTTLPTTKANPATSGQDMISSRSHKEVAVPVGENAGLRNKNLHPDSSDPLPQVSPEPSNQPSDKHSTHPSASYSNPSPPQYAKNFDDTQNSQKKSTASYETMMCNTGTSCDAEAVMNLLAAAPRKGGHV